MATGVTTTTQWASAVLINYVTSEVRTLEPELQLANLGLRKDVPTGFNQLAFPQTSKIATSNVSSITEGTDPSAYQWGSTAYTAGITQYGLIVQTSDVLVRNSAIEVVDAAVRQVKDAVIRQIDNSLQTTVGGGTNGVVYAGGKSSRSTLAAGDVLDTTTYTKAIKLLKQPSSGEPGVKPWKGGFRAFVTHTYTEYDLMLNTGSGGWTDVGRYTSAQDLIEGKMGNFRGGRVLVSENIQTYSSTVTVYPSFVLGAESFGWGYFQPLTPYLVTTPDSNNPLNLYTSIGAKCGIGSTRFDDSSTVYRIVRVESAASS